MERPLIQLAANNIEEHLDNCRALASKQGFLTITAASFESFMVYVEYLEKDNKRLSSYGVKGVFGK